MKKFISVVPARSGSKGLKNKNIVDFKGKPLLVHSLDHAKKSKYSKNFFLWTDSKLYFDIASKYHNLVDIGLREKYIDDHSTDTDFLTDLCDRLFKHNIDFDAFVLLRPTTPIRNKNIIDDCIIAFNKHWEFFDSLRTISISDKTPFKMWFKRNGPGESHIGEPLSNLLGNIKEAHSMPRQLLPTTYTQNCIVDIIKKETILKKKSSCGSRVYLYETDDILLDIDNYNDLKNA